MHQGGCEQQNAKKLVMSPEFLMDVFQLDFLGHEGLDEDPQQKDAEQQPRQTN